MHAPFTSRRLAIIAALAALSMPALPPRPQAGAVTSSRSSTGTPAQRPRVHPSAALSQARDADRLEYAGASR